MARADRPARPRGHGPAAGRTPREAGRDGAARRRAARRYAARDRDLQRRARRGTDAADADAMRRARWPLRAREALPRARRDPASPSRGARHEEGCDRGARAPRSGLRRSARRAAASGRSVEGGARDRAGAREGVAHAARAVRDGRRLRGARELSTPGSAKRTSSSRRCSRSRIGSTRRPRGCRWSSAPPSSRNSAPEAKDARRERAREGAPGVGARARGRAAARRRRSRARADLQQAREVGAPVVGARDRSHRGAGSGATARRRSRQIRQLCEQKLASRNLAFQWTVRAFELEPTNAAALHGRPAARERARAVARDRRLRSSARWRRSCLPSSSSS